MDHNPQILWLNFKEIPGVMFIPDPIPTPVMKLLALIASGNSAKRNTVWLYTVFQKSDAKIQVTVTTEYTYQN